MDHSAHCELITAEIGRFADVIDGADMATPVPTCPGWDLAALAKHTGVVHRWAMQMVRDRATERLDFRQVDRQLPDSPAHYAQWLRAGARALHEVLAATPGDTAVWAWGPDHHARFWSRRMVHESIVHRADAELALSIEPRLDTALAVDGVDEFLENFASAADSFAPTAKELKGRGETLHFHCTDGDGEWMITLTPEGFDWQHGHGKGDVAVRGAAKDLYLLIWGRAPLDGGAFQILGDRALIDRWLTLSAI